MNNFVHLHTHSDYSPRDGAQTVEQIARKAARLKMPAVALTDHGMAGGLLQLKKECEKVDIKPIYGFEAYVAPESRHTKEKIDNHTKTSYHLTVLAKSKIGLENLFILCSKAWLEGYYYKPRIDEELLKEHHEGLIVLSGCSSSRLCNYIKEEKYDEAIQHIKFMKELFKDDFYIEVQNHNLDWQVPLNTVLITLANGKDIPIVSTQDSHYQEREDSELHGHICKLAAGDLEFDSDHSWFKSRSEMEDMFSEEEHIFLDNTISVAEKCNCEWEYGKTIWPAYPLANKTPVEELKDLAKAGLIKRLEEPSEEYTERLNYELGLIEQMGFPPYFLIVADFINWAKENDIPVGPGRGSAAGSLVCYCIGITEVDPLKYGLLFERFINPSRISLPDIDVDLCKVKRDQVIQYVAKKYGEDRISQIGTYAVFKPRGSLRAFARTCGYEVSVGNKLAGMVPADIAGKQLKFKKVIAAEPKLLEVEEKKVVDLACKAEGIHSQIGVHAAGVVIADRPINKLLPLFLGKHGEIASQFDMHDVEEIGLIKIDFLGLKNLTVIAETVDLIEKIHGEKISINKLADGDKATYKLFANGDLDGIFQFENSSGFKKLCMQVRPQNISDLSMITAMYRPGPLEIGLTDQYSARRGGQSFEYDMPELESVLKETYGILIFQEDIMRICQELAGYTMPEADNMRKIVGKKLPEKMLKEKDKFIEGCIKKSIDKTKANKLFNDIEGFALYGFNKSHSVAYSFISYQTAWLKAHYPKEFYTALLNNSLNNPDDLVKYTYSAREREIPLLPPDVNRSDARFKLDSGQIIFGLSGVKGIGVKACEKLMGLRPEEGFTELADLVKAKIGKNIIVALAECGALEDICELSRNQIVEHVPDLIDHYKKLDNWRKMRDKRVIREQEISDAVAKGVKPPRRLPKLKDRPVLEELGEAKILTRSDRLAMEKKTLGLYLTGHPLDDYSRVLTMAKYTINDIKQGNVEDKEVVRIPVVISSVTKKFSKKKQSYGIAIIEDQTGRTDTAIFSHSWKKIKDKLEEGSVSVITGKIFKQIQDEGPPISRITIQDVSPIASSGNIGPIVVTLEDSTEVSFFPPKDPDSSRWQQAMAFVNNTKRMM